MKNYRHYKMVELINQKGSMSTSDLTKHFNVTDMTIRRDLNTLAQEGLIKRIHGGAVSLQPAEQADKSQIDTPAPESSIHIHLSEEKYHVEEKKKIAKKIASLIDENEIIFIGSGTTLAHVYDYMTVENATIVTNSMLVFSHFYDDPRYETILIGGTYRHISASFHGNLTDDISENFHVSKAFISANAIYKNNIYDKIAEEGLTQKIVFDNAKEKYLALTHHKFNQKNFYSFYQTQDLDYIITDDNLPDDVFEEYRQYTKILKAH